MMLALALAVASPVVLDGRIDPAEWRGASSVPLADGFTLLVKEEGPDILFAVRHPALTVASVDFYVVARDGTLLDMHASAKIGQRTSSGAGWTDWAWGNNRGWNSHISMQDPATRRYAPQAAREFRVARSLLPRRTVQMRIVVSGDRPLAWPVKATEFAPASWNALQLPLASQ